MSYATLQLTAAVEAGALAGASTFLHLTYQGTTAEPEIAARVLRQVGGNPVFGRPLGAEHVEVVVDSGEGVVVVTAYAWRLRLPSAIAAWLGPTVWAPLHGPRLRRRTRGGVRSGESR